MKTKVIFRLPLSESIQSFDEGEGNDHFVISPFLREHKTEMIKGSIKTCEVKTHKGYFEALALDICSVDDPSSLGSYTGIVESAKEAIRSGEFEKVVLAGKFYIESTASPYNVFESLLKEHPSAMVYIASYNGCLFIGASPETLLSKRESGLQTEALGGTKTHGEYSDKEWLEHKQIKDYISGILEDTGYHYTSEETVSKAAGIVEHLQTPFKIEAKTQMEDLQLASLLHPTSAVCGLPYEPALNFIKKYEGFDRNFYSGYIGFIFENGNFDLFVNLRCAECFQGFYLLYAGAGINAMSSASDEWDEINRKILTIAQWLK